MFAYISTPGRPPRNPITVVPEVEVGGRRDWAQAKDGKEEFHFIYFLYFILELNIRTTQKLN